jgi:polysaccharide pyruvyl transferase WcaK-like protein
MGRNIFMTKILIAGYYGLDNIEDETILSGMVNLLKNTFLLRIFQ